MLTLPIKRFWFDKLISGEKKEEYRDDTPYYSARLERYLGTFKMLYIQAGYSKNAPKALANVFIKKGFGRPEWGAVERKTYYVLVVLNIYRVN